MLFVSMFFWYFRELLSLFVNFMKKIILALNLLLMISCGQNTKPAEVELHLKKAMATFLYKTVNNDSSKVKFSIADVTYFSDSGFYQCDFRVIMSQGGKDTTGSMKARVAKDFSKVVRQL